MQQWQAALQVVIVGLSVGCCPLLISHDQRSQSTSWRRLCLYGTLCVSVCEVLIAMGMKLVYV